MILNLKNKSPKESKHQNYYTQIKSTKFKLKYLEA